MEHERSTDRPRTQAQRPTADRKRTQGRTPPAEARPRTQAAAPTGHAQAQQPAERTAAQKSAPASAQAKSTKKRKPRMRRMNRSALRIKLLTMLGVVAAVVVSLLIFFKVNTIQVIDHKQPEQAAQPEQAEPADAKTEDGAHIFYTRDEIIAASGIQLGDNLLTLNKAEVAANIRQALPYVSQVQIKRSFPSTVIITVTEYEISYGICDETGTWWLIGGDGRVLEQTTEQIATHDHIWIDGMRIEKPQPGDMIEPVGADGADPTELSAKKTAVLLVLEALEAEPEIAKQIVSVDVSSSYNVEMWYGTQYRVQLGKAEDRLTYKFACLLSILDNFAKEKRSYLSGTIDLTFFEGANARFLPTE